LEGTNLVAKGLPNAVAVMAIAERGSLLHAPDMYMDKIAVGPLAKGKIDITKSVSENVRNVAAALGRATEEITVVILDRPRHEKIIQEVRESGARVKLISDGDVSPAIAAAIEGTGVHMLLGIGGAPEGVIAAAALKCLGGDMQARLIPESQEEIIRAKTMGIADINQVLTLDDLVKSDDVMFAATAITDGDMLQGVNFFPGGARTRSLVMRSKTGTVRFVDAIHKLDKKPIFVQR
jgi:fructose-1,6-bisphosphatase II